MLVLFIGFCYAEVTAMLPVSGGEVAYAYKAFGVGHSFILGWLLSFGYLSVSAFEAISVGKIVSYLFSLVDQWPLYSVSGDVIFGSHLILAAFFVGLITYVNYAGVQNSIRFQIYLTITFLTIVRAVIIKGFWSGEVSNLTPLFAESSSVGVFAGIVSVFTTVPFWLVGFDTIPQGAEEAKEDVSHRMIGILILISIVAAVIFYILLIFSTAMVGDWTSLVKQDLFTAKAFELAFQSQFMVNGILVAILIGLLTSWNGFFLAGSRVLFAMGRGRIIAPPLGKSHPKFQTPYYAVLFSGVITFFSAFLGRGAMMSFVNVGSFCIAFAFLGVSFSFLALRKKFPDQERPYLAPGGRLSGYVAMTGSFLIILAITLPIFPASLKWPFEWAILLCLCLMGLVFWVLSKKSRDATSKDERDHFILEQYK